MHFIVRCFEDVPLVKFMYSLFTHMPGGVTIGNASLCHRVSCLLSAIIALCLLIKIDRTTTPSLQMKVFAQFLCVQDNFCLCLGSPLASLTLGDKYSSHPARDCLQAMLDSLLKCKQQGTLDLAFEKWGMPRFRNQDCTRYWGQWPPDFAVRDAKLPCS